MATNILQLAFPLFIYYFYSWRSSLWGQWSPTKDDGQFPKPLTQYSILRSQLAEATWDCFSFHLCTRIKIVTQSCLTLCDPMDCSPPGSLCPWDFPGKNTGVSSHSLLQGIFPTQRLNMGLLHCRRILYHLSHHQRSPTRTRLTFFTSLTQHPRIFHLSLSTGYFSANYKYIYKSLQNVSSSLCSVCCLDLLSFFFFFFNSLATLQKLTQTFTASTTSLRAPFLGSSGLNLHFLTSQGLTNGPSCCHRSPALRAGLSLVLCSRGMEFSDSFWYLWPNSMLKRYWKM